MVVLKRIDWKKNANHFLAMVMDTGSSCGCLSLPKRYLSLSNTSKWFYPPAVRSISFYFYNVLQLNYLTPLGYASWCICFQGTEWEWLIGWLTDGNKQQKWWWWWGLGRMQHFYCKCQRDKTERKVKNQLQESQSTLGYSCQSTHSFRFLVICSETFHFENDLAKPWPLEELEHTERNVCH